jgi:hypothetical protein
MGAAAGCQCMGAAAGCQYMGAAAGCAGAQEKAEQQVVQAQVRRREGKSRAAACQHVGAADLSPRQRF